MSPVIEDIGFSVAINGDLGAIGAPGRKNASGDGAVYISRKLGSGWSEPAIIYTPGIFTSLFGAALAVNDNYLVVGSPSFKVGGIVRGRISLYKRSGNFYNLLAHYQAQVPVNGETFGGSLSLYGNYLAVGCHTNHAEAPATTSNNVYIFTLANDALQQQQVITNFNSPTQENYGMAVAIDSTTLAIGAPTANSFGNTERGNRSAKRDRFRHTLCHLPTARVEQLSPNSLLAVSHLGRVYTCNDLMTTAYFSLHENRRDKFHFREYYDPASQ